MRIALVTPMLPLPHDPTRGRYIHEIARSLSRLATVRVFFQQIAYPRVPLLAPRSFVYGLAPADFQLEGIDLETFCYTAIPGLSRALNGMVSARALLPRLRTFSPDVVLAYWIYPDGYGALRAARRLGLPCVIGALGSDIHVRDRLNHWFTRRTIAEADALLTVSEDMRRAAIREYGAAPARVHTIINGYNREVFRYQPQALARTKLGLAADARLILYVGRFVQAKGLGELVEAFSLLSGRDPSLRLALVGDGVMRAELISRIAAAGIADRTLLPGGLAPEAVADWIAAADVLCLPSWSEGYPNVVVEAVACGCPVVATDVGGTREIVNPGNGVLISPRDLPSLRTGLLQVLQQPWDREAIAGSIRRSWDDVAAETATVCESILKNADRRLS